MQKPSRLDWAASHKDGTVTGMGCQRRLYVPGPHNFTRLYIWARRWLLERFVPTQRDYGIMAELNAHLCHQRSHRLCASAGGMCTTAGISILITKPRRVTTTASRGGSGTCTSWMEVIMMGWRVSRCRNIVIQPDHPKALGES